MSGIKSILVPAMGDAGDDTRLATAAAVAQLFQAHIECLHVRAEIGDQLASTLSVQPPTIASAEFMAAIATEVERRAHEARRAFDTVCRTQKIPVSAGIATTAAVSADWREESGDDVETLIVRACRHDLAVVRCEMPRQGPSRGLPPDSAGAVLICAGVPILLAGATAPRSFATVAIAWKDRPEASRAVTGAMPFIAAARKVVVMTVAESAAPGGYAADAVVERLRWHGYEAAELRCPAPERGAGAGHLVAEAVKAGADLLVMGAYGHSRLREWVFGGYTRHVLSGIDLPVLLAH